jgi:amino acid adenylation domain-containing protein
MVNGVQLFGFPKRPQQKFWLNLYRIDVPHLGHTAGKFPGARARMAETATAGFPLSPQQRHLWNAQGGQPASAQLAVLLEGKLDIANLKQSVRAVVTRHEILRTSFQRNAGMKFPFQLVSESSDLHWSEANLARPDADLSGNVDDLLAARKRLDCTCTPNVYCALAALAADRHLLVISLPGLCADAASLNRLLLDLRDAYSGSNQEEASPLQYADYSEWQNELLQKTDAESAAARDFWSRHDNAEVPPLVLPFERKAPGDADFEPEVVPVPLDAKLLQQLRAPSIGDAASLLLAAWQVLCWRLSGQPEVVIASVSDGRSYEELHGSIGLFARAIPVHTSFETERPFSDVVRQAQEERTELAQFQDYLELTGEDLPVGFSVEDRTPRHSSGGLTSAICELRCLTNRFHIELRCIAEDGAWRLEFKYDPECFRGEVAKLLAKRFAILLRAALADPNTAVSALPIMDDGEREQVVVEFNQTAVDFSRDKCIHELFEEQAVHNPNRAALRFGDQVFTYAELNARANQLAHLLRKRGVKANVAVGLAVERSAGMILGLLGILKAGGCYVPLVPDNPKARLAHQLAETAAPVVVTESALLDRLPDVAGETICLDRDGSSLDKQSTANPERINSADDLVYVIYTSGSTGTPKGVAIRHSNLVNYSQFICARLKLDEYPDGLNFATVSTISADLGNTCIFPSLISGGCLHVIGYETGMAANLFAKYCAEHPIDVLKITPSQLTTLLNEADGSRILPRQYLLLGGEASSWQLVERITEAADCTVLNHYGPTEATVGCCTFSVRENDVSAWSPATVPIGRPIANVELYILDQRLLPTPIGVPGELCIGGAGLAKGYLNQPEQTAQRFVAHPFSKDASARLYRTGDLARFLPDGSVEFLGRIDQQVKIRGFRVEPAEIEAVLKQHPAVKQAVIVPYADQAGDKRLAAYFVGNKPPASEELRGFLLLHLPEYMVPSAFVALESIPLTPNGKVDVRALPAPEASGANSPREFVVPRNPSEEHLVEIWKEILKLPAVSVDANFFELGGHSLLATQIISRIRSAFRVQMPLHSFLETPTIMGLAEKIALCPAAESEEEEMARLLKELESISDEEAERLLAAEQERQSGPDKGDPRG